MALARTYATFLFSMQKKAIAGAYLGRLAAFRRSRCESSRHAGSLRVMCEIVLRGEDRQEIKAPVVIGDPANHNIGFYIEWLI